MVVRLIRDSHGSFYGHVICEFADHEKALRAMTKNGMKFGRQTVTITSVAPRGGSSRSSGNNSESLSSGGYRGSRPGLLGERPPQGARFPSGPNPFVEALHANLGGNPPPRHMGPRGPRFGSRMRPPHPRFGGPRGPRPNGGIPPLTSVNLDQELFNKPGMFGIVLRREFSVLYRN